MVDQGELAAAGWRRRNVASEPRLSESVGLYRSLGYEVLLVPAARVRGAGGLEGSCTACLEAGGDPERDQVIYTRPKAGTRIE